MRERTRLNVVILALCQALYLSASSIQVALSGLVGAMLAPDKLLATLPFSLITVMTASTTIPASFVMARLGRRAGFVLGALIGGTGGAISSIAIFRQSFIAFCIGNALMGCFQAVAQYYRFAAADAAEPAFKSRAVSWVMAGGVAAALLGPGIAGFSKDLFAPITFAGSYLAIVVLAALSILLLSRLSIPVPAAAAAAGQGGRKLAVIARQPAFIAADAIGIIRMHLIGMFAPSFVTGSLIARFGVTRILLAGAGMLLASAVAALSGLALYNFWAALALLGVGWNFLYVGGTTLLTAAYRPEERAKTQAANEFLTFGVVAVASFASGGVMARIGWNAINYATFPLLLIAAATTLWYATVSRRW